MRSVEAMLMNVDARLYARNARLARLSANGREVDAYAGFFTYKEKSFLSIYTSTFAATPRQPWPDTVETAPTQFIYASTLKPFYAKLDAVSALGYRDSAVRTRTAGFDRPDRLGASAPFRSEAGAFSCPRSMAGCDRRPSGLLGPNPKSVNRLHPVTQSFDSDGDGSKSLIRIPS